MRIRPPRRPVALMVTFALLAACLGACGSSDGQDTGAAPTTAAPTTPAAKGRFTIKQVEELAGLKPAADGKSWTSLTGCRVTAILLTNAEIETNRTSQDAPVVSNGADDVGVKFEPVAGCREALLANLSQVK